MKPFYLVETITKDKLVHQGIFFRPEKPSKKAILWVHGLSGKFYSDPDMMESFAQLCDEEGWGFASFNNRGHDLVSSTHRLDPSSSSGYTYAFGGAGYENFKECVWDVHAAIEFLVARGFSEVILVGHSTGATKVCFAEGTKPHKNVAAVVLAGALSDRLAGDVDDEKLKTDLARIQRLITEGKGDELVNGLSFFPMTPKRFLSLYQKGSAEDVFDFDNGEKSLHVFSAITKPLFVIISEKDEYLNGPASDIVRLFDEKTTSGNYKSLIFPDANHGFEGKEKEFVRSVAEWVRTI